MRMCTAQSVLSHPPSSLEMKFQSSSLLSCPAAYPSRPPITRVMKTVVVTYNSWTLVWRYPKWAFDWAYNVFPAIQNGCFFIFLMEDGETLMLVTVRLLALQGQGSGLVHCRQGCWYTVIGSSHILTIPSELVNIFIAFEFILSLSLWVCVCVSVSLSFLLAFGNDLISLG
jgi:hypothetical protein